MAIYRMSARRPLRRRFRSSRRNVKARRLLRPTLNPRDARALHGLSTRPPSFYQPSANIVGGFKETQIATLRYADTINLISVTAGPVANIFRLNSAFDPDFTGLGHQPLYFDQYTAAYQKYTVLSSKITVSFLPIAHDVDSAGGVGPYIVGIVGSNASAFGTTISQLMEANKSVYAPMARDDAGPSVKTLTLDYIPQRDLGLPPTDDTLGADAGSNPASSYFANVWAASVNGSILQVNVCVTIEQKIKFWRQGFTAQS